VEKWGNVVFDKQELTYAEIQTHALPDDKGVVEVGDEVLRCGEALFQPSLCSKQSRAVPQLVYDSVSKCEHSVTRKLYSHLVMCGGSTMFPGFEARMKKELGVLLPEGVNDYLKFAPVPTQRKNTVWFGASLQASLSTTTWITKEQYEEAGGI